MVPAAFRTMFAYADRAEVCEHYDQVSGTFAEHFAKASALMAGAKEEDPCLFGLSPGALAPDLVHEPARALEHEVEKALAGGRYLPQRSCCCEARWFGSDVHDEWQ